LTAMATTTTATDEKPTNVEEAKAEEDSGPIETVQSSDEPKYPSAKALLAIIPALLLSVFLVALVSQFFLLRICHYL
jgi:hypothetical protein